MEELRGRSYRPFLEGDVLVAKITPSMENGKGALARGLVNGVGFGSTEFHVLRPTIAVDPMYLTRYVLQPGFREEARRHMTGTAGQLRVPARYLERAVLPLPPLAEQRRIVTAIDEQLSRLEAALSQVRAADIRLATLRARIVDAAVSGGWKRSPLGELIQTLRNGVFVSRPGIAPPGIPIFRISAVRPMALDVHDIRYAAITEEAAAGYFVETGNLLFTRYSGNPKFVGACAVAPMLPQRTLHPDKLIRVVVDETRAIPEFLELAFASTSVRQEVEARLKTTAGQVGIAGGQLRTVPVPRPPLEEQRRITVEVRGQLATTEHLSGATARASRRTVALRRAILAKAFRGELVQQDPDDESVSVLLERIAAERAGPNPPWKRRGTTPA